MKEIDRDRPMIAIHKNGAETDYVRRIDGSKALRIVSDYEGVTTAYFDKYGQPKDDFCPWVVRNVEDNKVDWSLPLEAVHASGMTKRAHLNNPYDGKGFPMVYIEGDNTYWFAHNGHGGTSGWRIRNTQSYTDAASQLAEEAELRRNGFDTDNWRRAADTIPIDRALWERVEGLARGMASDMEADCDYATRHSYRRYQEARAIVGLLPAVVVDEDEKIAKEISKEAGSMQHLVLLGIKRGRAMERGE